MSASLPLVSFLQAGAIMSTNKQKVLLLWGSRKSYAQPPIHGSKAFVYQNDFFLKHRYPWHEYENTLEVSIADAQILLSMQDALALPLTWHIDKKNYFKAAFAEIMYFLQNGDLQKAVPYLFCNAKYRMQASSLQYCLINALNKINHSPGYLYGCWHYGNGILGCTPELLFQYVASEPQTVRTMALAGTRNKNSTLAQFTEDAKEAHEHQLVINGITLAMQKFGHVKIGTRSTIEAHYLTHLVTPIEIILHKDFKFTELVNTLHPTPALGAFPKAFGKQWLQNYNTIIPRYYYGAPIGFVDSMGNASCFVGIRNIQWNRDKIFIGAGCGVVADSVFENEWQEIQNKIAAIKGIFTL